MQRMSGVISGSYSTPWTPAPGPSAAACPSAPSWAGAQGLAAAGAQGPAAAGASWAGAQGLPAAGASWAGSQGPGSRTTLYSAPAMFSPFGDAVEGSLDHLLIQELTVEDTTKQELSEDEEAEEEQSEGAVQENPKSTVTLLNFMMLKRHDEEWTVLSLHLFLRNSDIDFLISLASVQGNPEKLLKGLGCVAYGARILSNSVYLGRAPGVDSLDTRVAFALIDCCVQYSIELGGNVLTYKRGQRLLTDLCSQAKRMAGNRMGRRHVFDAEGNNFIQQLLHKYPNKGFILRRGT
ncbi:uncharacterized protein LOC132201702 isoform X2 [Neocloeon triangulifer]|uniref:uncharacterized protein LOC132201702 isoform X2 n=1 Tax=Neocloeon triangulifer TaxID=2078957 RepID=UPI00286F5404|nr:uncharacterized protein LOC132201702 isoform X2 [Neocloeon triangulifer]